MFRIHYLLTSILSFFLLIASVWLFLYTKELRYAYYTSDDQLSLEMRPHVQISRVIAIVLALVFVYYIFVFIYGFIKTKHTAILVLGVLGVFFTAVAVFFDLLMVMGFGTSFDELGPVFTLWSLLMLFFTIPSYVLCGKSRLKVYYSKLELEKGFLKGAVGEMSSLSEVTFSSTEVSPEDPRKFFKLPSNKSDDSKF